MVGKFGSERKQKKFVFNFQSFFQNTRCRLGGNGGEEEERGGNLD